MGEIELTLSSNQAKAQQEPIVLRLEVPQEIQQEAAQMIGWQEELSSEEAQEVERLTGKIDLQDSTSIISYSATKQRKFKHFAETVLVITMGSDLSEIGDALSEIAARIQELTASSEVKTRGVFGGRSNRIKKIRQQYDAATATLEQVKRKLEGYRLKLRVDSRALDTMYQEVLQYHRDLAIRVLAGERKLESVRSNTLNALRQRANVTGAQEIILAANDLDGKCVSFEKRLHDLKLTQVVCLQTATQIQLVQQSNREIALKIESMINNAIPLWQQSVAAALTVQYVEEAFASDNARLLVAIDEALGIQQTEQERRGSTNAEIRQCLAAIG